MWELLFVHHSESKHLANMDEFISTNDIDCMKFTFYKTKNLCIKSQTDSLSQINPLSYLIFVSIFKCFNAKL